MEERITGHAYNLNEAQVAERNKTIWQLRLEGKSQAAIAEEVGLSQSQISRILDEMAENHSSEELDKYFILQLNRIEAMVEATWRMAQAEYLAHGNGKLIRDNDGNPIVDVSPNLAAYARYMDALKELNKMKGLYAPEKKEVSGQVDLAPEIMERLRLMEEQDNAS